MATPKDDYWYDQGRNSGNTPNNDTSDSGWKSYNDGKQQRDLDRAVEDSNRKAWDQNK